VTATAAHPDLADDDGSLWLSPRRLRKYQWAKVVGATLMSAIFIGWLIIQWSNPAMRFLAIGLILVTAFVVFTSVMDDVSRSHGRQLRIDADAITITTPESQTHVRLADIARGEWREDALDTAGLWLFDHNNRQLAHLDLNFVGDQDEARAFLHWARQRADLNFNVIWPSTE